MKTTLHYYYFDLTKEEESEQYEKLREGLKTFRTPVWKMDRQHDFYDKELLSYMEKVKAFDGKEVTIEPDYLFNDQWNVVEGLRLFNWAEYVFLNRDIREGYYIDQTPEMEAILQNTCKCGYCGKLEQVSSGLTFCQNCLDSEVLKPDDLGLLRLMPVSSRTPRPPLSEAEKEVLMPLYNRAQTYGYTERGKALIAKKRADLLAEYDKTMHHAKTKFEGFTWLMDHGLQIVNVIYYDHKNQFSFGWRNPLSGDVLAMIQDVIEDFPFDYELKCADGRVLTKEKRA